ncbi:MAG TPA: SDR family NAD(P)-dependent oxidoreductase [Enteractinococcus sp.]
MTTPSVIEETKAQEFTLTYNRAVAFITGGASGLGLAQARLLGRLGCRIVIADVQSEALESATIQLREEQIEVLAIQLDVRDREAYAAAGQTVYEHFGEFPRLLFNTAGVNGFGPLHKASYSDFDWIVGVNLNGVINGIQTFLPKMLHHKQPAWIATTGSMAGFMGSSSAGIYAATKAAVFNLMESYHKSLSDECVGVSIVCPASIQSNIAETLDLRPAELAQTSSFNNDPEFRALQRRLYSSGMDPLQLAGHVVEGIVDKRLYIVPFTETRTALQEYFDEVLAAFDSYGSPDVEAQRRAADFVEYQQQVNLLRQNS